MIFIALLHGVWRETFWYFGGVLGVFTRDKSTSGERRSNRQAENERWRRSDDAVVCSCRFIHGPFILEADCSAIFAEFRLTAYSEVAKMMPTMPPDSHKISVKIIEAIKQHPVLYINDVKGTSVKVQEFRQKVWKRISDELSLDPLWVRLKWKNLRDTYCRILKYKNKTDKGGRRKKWIFQDHLNFLKFPYEPDYQPQCVELTEEYIQEINEGGVSSEGLLEQLEDRNDEDYSEYLEVLEETTADPVLGDTVMGISIRDSDQQQITDRVSEIDTRINHHDNHDHHRQEIESYVQQIQSKYRKIRPKRMKIEPSVAGDLLNNYSLLKSPGFSLVQKTDQLNNSSIEAQPIIITTPPIVPVPPSTTAAISLLQKDSPAAEPNQDQPHSHGKTSIELFFDSMVQTVKLLPLKAQVDIKMAVCRIVTEAEVRFSRHSAKSKNTQQFITPPGMIPKLVLVPCSMIDNPGNEG